MGTPPNFKCQDYFRIYLVWVVTLSPDNGINGRRGFVPKLGFLWHRSPIKSRLGTEYKNLYGEIPLLE